MHGLPHIWLPESAPTKRIPPGLPASQGWRAQGSETALFPHRGQRLCLQELRRETCGGSRDGSCTDSRTSASQASRLLLKTPVQPASLTLRGDHEAVPHSGGEGGPKLGLAQRVPLKESLTHTRTTYSSMKRFTTRRKTQFTPLRSLPRVQQAQWLSGLSPHSSPEEPALPWEQIAVKLFDQESLIALQKGPGKPSVASTSGSQSTRTPSHQELKMQRIHILQQLLRQEVEGLATGNCAALNGGSTLDTTERQPPVAEDSSTLSAPAHKSETPLALPEHSGVTEALPAEEREEPQACPGEDTKESQPCSTTELKPPVPHRAEPEPPAPCLPALAGPPLPSCRGQAEPPEARPGIQLGASAASALQAGNPESSPEPCCSQGPPAATSLTSTQSPVCASFPIHSLHSSRSPTGRSGPSSVAPRTLALRQRLRACLTTIHCFHEARLDDECAFYTSRALPPGPTRVCTNPVATMLEWQDALRFIPVGPVAPQDSPS